MSLPIRSRCVWSTFLLAGLLAGCPLAPTGLAEGSRCVRSTQCNPGLVCSAAGACTSDLTGFGNGMVPNSDVPANDDAGSDAGDLADAGTPMDAPVIPMDVPTMDVPAVPMDVPVVMPDVPATPDTPPDVPADAGVDAGMPDTPPDPPDAPEVDAP